MSLPTSCKDGQRSVRLSDEQDASERPPNMFSERPSPPHRASPLQQRVGDFPDSRNPVMDNPEESSVCFPFSYSIICSDTS
jgi:hypothetical protein